MTFEDQHTDQKSLRKVTGKNPDWTGLARDCVCFANGSGGRLLIGIEDGASEPPADQTIPPLLLERIRKRIQAECLISASFSPHRTINLQKPATYSCRA